MLTLPDSLAAFAPYRQFMLWRLATDDKGEPTKLPCNRNGQVCDSHDPTYWLDANEALTCAQSLGLGVAFVFTDNDPFFFLDIDNCLNDDGQWSELSQEVCALFPGAAIEVSTSGKGLHIFGIGLPVFGHSNKTVTERGKLELYTRKRFVALTGDRIIGNAGTNHQEVIAWFSQHYMTGSNTNERTIYDWTDTPCDEWDGYHDDGELLTAAFSSSNMFDSGGFAELFAGDHDSLMMRFPDGPGCYDESRADMTLACKLAYWTGKDCERMERLMLMSGLARDKWFKRQNNYLRATIRKACGTVDKVHQLRQQAAPSTQAPTIIASADEVLISEGTQFMPASNQVDYFKDCVYVQSSHSIFIPTGEILSAKQFDVRYGGKIFFIDSTNDKSTKSAFEAFTQSQYCRYPMVHETCFRPDLPTGKVISKGNTRFVNRYADIPVRRVKGDASPFLNHLATILPVQDDRDKLLAYIAACVQFKGDKFKWAPLIQGVPGNGKTVITKVVEYAIGEDYCSVPQAHELGSKFNEPWLINKILVGVNDVYIKDSHDDIIEVLKPLITDERAGTQAKGADMKTSNIIANFILNCNRKDAIKKVRGDRRFAPFFTAQQSEDDLIRDGLDADYFVKLHQWLVDDGYAIMADYLMTYDIPAELSPALSNGGRMNRAPITSSTGDALRSGISHSEQWVQEAIDEGEVGFCGGWVSSYHLRKLMEYRRIRISPLQMADLLLNMGYKHHPALANGRSPARLPCDDNHKSILYIAKNAWHLAAINDGKTACANYVDAQTKKIASTFAMTNSIG